MLHVYGNIKYPNKDEYYGQFKNMYKPCKHGEGVFIEASTGRVERRIYENDMVKKVIEVIKDGHQRS